MGPVTDDCTEEVILNNSEATTLEDTIENQTTEEILPTDGDHSEEIPTFSDYDEEYEPSIDTLSESELIYYHAKEWIDSLSRDDVMSLSLLLHHVANSKNLRLSTNICS